METTDPTAIVVATTPTTTLGTATTNSMTTATLDVPGATLHYQVTATTFVTPTPTGREHGLELRKLFAAR